MGNRKIDPEYFERERLFELSEPIKKIGEPYRLTVAQFLTRGLDAENLFRKRVFALFGFDEDGFILNDAALAQELGKLGIPISKSKLNRIRIRIENRPCNNNCRFYFLSRNGKKVDAASREAAYEIGIKNGKSRLKEIAIEANMPVVIAQKPEDIIENLEWAEEQAALYLWVQKFYYGLIVKRIDYEKKQVLGECVSGYENSLTLAIDACRVLLFRIITGQARVEEAMLYRRAVEEIIDSVTRNSKSWDETRSF